MIRPSHGFELQSQRPKPLSSTCLRGWKCPTGVLLLSNPTYWPHKSNYWELVSLCVCLGGGYQRRSDESLHGGSNSVCWVCDPIARSLWAPQCVWMYVLVLCVYHRTIIMCMLHTDPNNSPPHRHGRSIFPSLTYGDCRHSASAGARFGEEFLHQWESAGVMVWIVSPPNTSPAVT